MANCFISCCKKIKSIPTRVSCFLLLCLQDACLNYYLIHYQHIGWAWWVLPDVVVLILFLLTFFFGYRFFSDPKYYEGKRNDSRTAILHSWFGVISWCFYSIILSSKIGFSFTEFAYKLDESSFWGPNTIKTSMALAGLVYLLLLSTLHDAKPGTNRRKYIEELTGTVVFDILDGIDSMEILYEPEARGTMMTGVDVVIIIVACINVFLPTIPLITLAKTNYGHEKLSQKMIIAHKVTLAFIVNLPLLVTRMVVWHGMSHGVSIFTLKNVIVICMVLYDLYETHEHEHPKSDSYDVKESEVDGKARNDNGDMGAQNYELEDRFNYA